jgi:hypothetical protein
VELIGNDSSGCAISGQSDATLTARLPGHVAALLAYTALAIPATWPLASRFTDALAGDRTDPWQTVWGFWWWRQSVAAGQSPMFSPLLWWPDGAPLWLQTWDLPATLAAVATTSTLSIVTVYNLALFASFPLSGFTFYLLNRALWGNALGAFCAGCLYTFSTYHFSHSVANLHIASMQWAPLYLLGLFLMFQRGGAGVAVLTGLGLALAALTSPYYLVFSAIASVVLVPAWLVMVPTSSGRRVLTDLAIGGAVFAAAAGWLVVGMVFAYASEPYAGSHNPLLFSADLQSFVTPNPVSRWSSAITLWRTWNSSNSIWVSAAYIGSIALALALSAAARHPRAKSFVVVAGVGAVLAVGPHIQIGGRVYADYTMPYAWLEAAVPAVGFGGLPGRFAWLTTLGLATAAGASLSDLCRHSRRRAVLAVLLTALALIETWPRPLQMTMFEQPAIMRDWARDPAPWGVLDATWISRALWHQTIHGHPIVGGYLTRTPQERANALRKDPVAAALMSEWLQVPEPAPQTVDGGIALARLRGWRIRFVIVDARQSSRPEQWGLVRRFASDDVAVYEVPQPIMSDALRRP